MTKSQKDKYAQFEKQCLVIVNAICRRNKWLYGHHSIIMETYHKPFQTLYKHRITEASKHLHEMLLKLQRYALNMICRKGSTMWLADKVSTSSLLRITEAKVSQVLMTTPKRTDQNLITRSN